jgi:hypothetical protein
MKKRLIALVFFGLKSSFVLAEGAPSLADFALQRSIIVQQDTPLQSFELPLDVYQTVVSPTLNDVRIFNSSGTVVPFEIKQIESTEQQAAITSSLPFFPIQGISAGSSSESTEVKIVEDDHGKIVSVRFDDSKTPTLVSSNSYLVDMREFHQQLRTLQFHWQSTAQMVGITIEKSSDLKSWQRVTSGVLANLNYLGHSVSQNSIDCLINSGQFLRIIASENTPLSIQAIEATYYKTETIAPLPQSATIRANETLDQGKSFQYDTGGFLPMHSISVAFAEQNIITRLIISSKPSLDSPWKERLKASAYRIRVDGNDLVSGFQNFSTVISDRYWRIDSYDQEAHISSPPVLTFRWQPQRVVFLAQGTPPFVIAYGSALMRAIPYKNASISSLTNTLQITSTDSIVGAPQQAGGEKSLIPLAAKVSLPWKKWILWGILALTLIVVLIMAKRLFKELQEGSK